MRALVRRTATVVTVGIVFLAGGGGHGHTLRAQAAKDTARVLMVDNNASFTPGNEYLGLFQYSPAHISVVQGEPVEFVNPAGNFFPHTAVSISFSGSGADRTLVSGQLFNSSPSRDTIIGIGGSWTLDTSTLAPGQYAYFCTIHPWMVGSLTVQPAS